jgi:hypothetical protein
MLSTPWTYQYKESAWFFEHKNKYPSLEESLLELFKTEYAIGEINRRRAMNQRLKYNHRVTHWLDKLTDHADALANIVAPEVLGHLEKWLEFHSGSGFANIILDLNDEGLGEAINDKGVITLGGAFVYKIGDDEIIEAFLRDNAHFVEQFISEDGEQWEESGEDPSTWDNEQKIEYVKDSIEGIGYDYKGLKDWLGQWGNFTQVVHSIIQQTVFPAWRQWWGGQLETAEDDVQAAHDRLQNAIESGRLNEILVAINLALNTQHVHGAMAEHMDVGQDILDTLSNLDTGQIDEFVDMATGPDWKTAIESMEPWQHKYAYENLEHALSQMPISYNDLGNNPDDVPYALIHGRIFFGEPGQNHSQLFGQKLKDLFGGGRTGELESFKHFSEGYSGRFDFVNNAITIRIFGGKYITPPNEAIEHIKQAFRAEVNKRGLPEPAFIAIIPSSNNDPIMTEEGKWEIYSSKDAYIKLAQQEEKTVESDDGSDEDESGSGYYKQDYQSSFADCDRYQSDRYELMISLRETDKRYSIGCQVNSTQLGVASYVQYWHYNKDEFSESKNTFSRIKKISIRLKNEIEHGDIPMSIILPMFRSGMQEIDIAHKENTGIYSYNKSQEVEKAPDWRETLYGLRYPGHDIGIVSDSWNTDEQDKEIEVTGENNRNKMYKYKYAHIFNYIGKNWPFFGTAAAFMAWYAAAGGTPTGFKKYIQPAIEQSQQVYEYTNQMQDLQLLQPAVEQALQESGHENNISQSVDLNEWYEKIITQESAGKSRATSHKDARGLMQIMEPTWKEWTKKMYGTELDFEMAYNPEINKKVGVTYLGWIQDTLRKWMGEEPSVEHILAAYNGGIGRLRKNKYDVWHMPEETKNYIERITGTQRPKDMAELSSPKIRSKEVPPNLIPPFSSKQVQIVQNKKAYQQADKAVEDLVRSLSDQGQSWHKIVKYLLSEGVPKQWFSDLNQVYLLHRTRYGNTSQKKPDIFGSKSKPAK